VNVRHVVVEDVAQAGVKVKNVEVGSLTKLADLVVVVADVLHVGIVVVSTCWIHCFNGRGVVSGYEGLCSGFCINLWIKEAFSGSQWEESVVSRRGQVAVGNDVYVDR
jgi:hypothetical protein